MRIYSNGSARSERWLYELATSICTIVLFTCIAARVQAQSSAKPSKKELMRDTLDGKLDFSRFLIEAHGFIPVPIIITEPALGSFGGLIAPVFIQPKRLPGYDGYIPPDITAGVGMYTANGSYGLGALRSGSFPKQGLKYRVGIFYASLNLSFYRDLPAIGESEFNFNIKTIPIFLSLSKKVLKQDVYLGLKYSYAITQVESRPAGNLPSFVEPLEADSNTGTLGVFVDWDKRDNIFTANSGFRLNIAYNMNATWTASDYTYQRLNTSFLWFMPISTKWISGLRLEVQHVFDTPPFYLLPGINLRGVPAARYQGATTLIAETEQRFDLNTRWSVLGFAGIGKALDDNESFSEADNVYSVGTGFRYLLARAFKVRTGVDVAVGPDSFGWYIVFGHNWNR